MARACRARIAFLVISISLVACTDTAAKTLPASPSPAVVTASPVPPAPSPAPPLLLDVGKVSGEGRSGPTRRVDLGPAVQGVRTTLSELYRIGFVDPSAWQDGTFTPLFRLFERDVRPQAHRDLRRLSLGPLSRSVDAVRPGRARFGVRFLADASGRPLVALARTTFRATVRGDEGRGDVAQTGRFVLRRADGVWRIAGYRVRTRVPTKLDRPAPASKAEFAPGVPASRPTFILAIGSDARPNEAVAATRADSIHVIGINARRGIVSVLGIPRDSWVPIPGHGTAKINAALVYGGPELVVDTVQRLTGIPIDAYALTGFDGFVHGVRAIGGIDIRIPYAITDRYAHARFKPGPMKLGGKQALAFSRARHALREGDFERSLNQGRLLVAALATLRSQLRGGDAALVTWAVAAARYLKTDLSQEDLFELLLAAPAFDPARVRNVVASGRVGSASGQSVVFLDARARATFRDLARDGVIGT
jgi:LCP family protein required for cell wall assembly